MIRKRNSPSGQTVKPSGFTLIELLVVIGSETKIHPAALHDFFAIELDLEGPIFLTRIAEATAIKIDFRRAGYFKRPRCRLGRLTKQAQGLVFALALV